VKFPPGPILDRETRNLSTFSKGVVVFDRDGTLIEDAGQHNNPEGLVFLPGVIEALKVLNSLNYGIAVASNQSGLESEKFSLEKLMRFNDSLKEALSLNGAGEIHLIAICPHLGTSNCTCRKPKPGLLQEIEKSGIGEICLFVGNSDSDRQAADSHCIEYLDVNSQSILSGILNWSGK
jgi:histidinol-phosphate phosphatase family protein